MEPDDLITAIDALVGAVKFTGSAGHLLNRWAGTCALRSIAIQGVLTGLADALRSLLLEVSIAVRNVERSQPAASAG
ncbi:hypothetical protein [Streptomyces sp. NPDC050564]|uniref:hypothetical protein n=1 Tax=Streptomyces sp. NPDC050564 TaxID=3365631 RepID=UPI0037BB215D